MNRDMDVIRRIALTVADAPYNEHIQQIEGISPEVFVANAIWMEEAGLAVVIPPASKRSLAGVPHVFVVRLTWAGCEFADSVRSDTVWNKAKQSLLKPASSFTFGILKDWLKTEIQQGLPSFR